MVLNSFSENPESVFINEMKAIISDIERLSQQRKNVLVVGWTCSRHFDVMLSLVKVVKNPFFIVGWSAERARLYAETLCEW